MDHLTGNPLRFAPEGDTIDIPPNHIKQLEGQFSDKIDYSW